MESSTQLSNEQRQEALLCLVTEHSALQSARSTTVSESNGRVSIFLATVSSALITLGFVGQGSITSDGFLVFALILLPLLFFLGVVTFTRVTQAGAEDLLYGRGINRIRHFYIELAPPIQDYFILSAHDDTAGVLKNMGIKPSPWQLLLTTSGMIGVIDSVILGALVLLLAFRLFMLPSVVGLALSVVLFVVSIVIHQRHQTTQHDRVMSNVKIMFPSDLGQ